MTTPSWENFQKFFFHDIESGLSLDASRIGLEEGFLKEMEPKLERAFKSMEQLERGAIANPDENRMVGHYWLRAPQLAPTPEIREEIEQTLERLQTFAAQIHAGEIRPERAERFTTVLSIGIGGSALGPQFVSAALESADDPLKIYFFDNTDPEGMDHILAQIGDELRRTLCVVISKSGGTKETRNGMLEAQNAYDRLGLHFGRHAVAITGAGSQLDQYAVTHQWLARFPMWDWVGGRTSELSAVGLLPAALQGFNVEALLQGAATMDVLTRRSDWRQNPAALLALAWYKATDGQGRKDMVILPYSDRLMLLSRYLQQLIMESLGKERDLEGNIVNQGIAVYGNKGSTDQHAYVQQLRDGLNNFFVTFIEVRQAPTDTVKVEDNFTAGDYLQGFLRGTRKALAESGRQSITISIPTVNAYTLGMLIALFERTVSFYASLIHINAYHQPGVQAGKLAANVFLKLLAAAEGALTTAPATAADVAAKVGADEEDTYHALVHIAESGKAKWVLADCPCRDTFSL